VALKAARLEGTKKVQPAPLGVGKGRPAATGVTVKAGVVGDNCPLEGGDGVSDILERHGVLTARERPSEKLSVFGDCLQFIHQFVGVLGHF
jgi:hypothetical protein